MTYFLQNLQLKYLVDECKNEIKHKWIYLKYELALYYSNNNKKVVL